MEILATFIVGLILGNFLPAYFSQKGKLAAVKEDIGTITEKVENIKTDNALILEAVRSKNTLRSLAVEKRLEVHQKAFTSWLNMSRAIHSPEITKMVIECQEFWGENCIYLDPKARDAFVEAYHSASNHRSLLDTYRGTGNKEGTQEIKDNFQRIMGAGNLILASMEIPPLTERNLEELGVEENA